MPTEELRILLIEDLADDAEFIERKLRRSPISFITRRVETKEQFLEALADFAPSIILADYSLPKFNALDALRLLQAQERNIPFILVTGTQSEEVAVACMQEGADDYILKDRLARLPAAIEKAIEKKDIERKRRQALAALRRNAQQFKLITENTRDIICLVEAGGRIVYVSPSCTQRLGYEPHEIMNGDATCFLTSGERGALGDALRAMVLSGSLRRSEFRCRHKNGGWKVFEATGAWIAEDEASTRRAVLVCRDITRRKRSEALLRRTNETLTETLESLKRSHMELQSVHLQLIQAEKMESVGRLAAGVAHEVKNPLTVLLMGTEYLRKHVDRMDGEVGIALDEMAEAALRANEVLRGLLDFSRPGKLELQLHDINEVLEHSLTLVKHELSRTSVEVERKLSSDLPPLMLDRGKMGQVFVNLMTNAVQAMEGGGVLGVTTRLARTADIAGAVAAAHPEPHAVVVEISDTGSGIPEKQLHRVFDPFFTTKATGSGTGLGLTVTEKIVELHRGSVSLTNRPSGGVLATVVLWPGHGELPS